MYSVSELYIAPRPRDLRGAAAVLRALPLSIFSFEVAPRFCVSDLKGPLLCVKSFDIVSRFRNSHARSSSFCVESFEIVFRFNTSVMPRALCGLEALWLPDPAGLKLEDGVGASWENPFGEI